MEVYTNTHTERHSHAHAHTIVYPFHSHLTSFMKVIETPFLRSSILRSSIYRWKMLYIIKRSLSRSLWFCLCSVYKEYLPQFSCVSFSFLSLPLFWFIRFLSLSRLYLLKPKHINCLAGFCLACSLFFSLAFLSQSVSMCVCMVGVHFCMFANVSMLKVPANFHFIHIENDPVEYCTQMQILSQNLENGIYTFSRPIYRHRQSHALQWKWAPYRRVHSE